MLAGFVGIFLRRLDPLLQLVAGAPIFEEFFKFGLALTVASILPLRSRVPRFVIALAWGAGFGVFEHWLTYPDEPVEALRFRVAFHAATPGLSMAAYDAVASLPDVRARWFSTLPATVFHAINNIGALIFGLAGLASGEDLSRSALLFGNAMAVTVGIVAVFALVAQGPIRRGLGGAWSWFASHGLHADRPRGWDANERVGERDR